MVKTQDHFPPGDKCRAPWSSRERVRNVGCGLSNPGHRYFGSWRIQPLLFACCIVSRVSFTVM